MATEMLFIVTHLLSVQHRWLSLAFFLSTPTFTHRCVMIETIKNDDDDDDVGPTVTGLQHDRFRFVAVSLSCSVVVSS